MDDQPAAPGLTRFLASSVHDMKNSLGVVSGALAALLADPARRADPAYATLAHMLYQTQRVNDNLVQLQALARQVGQPGYPLDAQPRLVSQVLEQVAAQHQVLLDARAITLQVSVPAQLIWELDEDLILGVLGQAINSAIRYTRDTIRLSAEAGDGWLTVCVEDNGAGYPAPLLAALDAPGAFDVPLSADGADGVDAAPAGAGLGLYFCAAAAAMHRHRGRQGAMALANGGVLGGGCFRLRLP